MDEVSSHVRLDPAVTMTAKAAQQIVPPRPRIPWWKGLGAGSEEKREPVSDIETALVDSLKALDPNRPIREADNDQVAVTNPDFMSTRPVSLDSEVRQRECSLMMRTRKWDTNA